MTSLEIAPSHIAGDAAADAFAPERSAAQAGVRLTPRALKVAVIASDAAVLAFGFAVAFGVQFLVRPVPGRTILNHLALVGVSVPAFALAAMWNRMYLARANARRAEEAGHVARTVLVGMGFLVALSVAFKYENLSRLWVATAGTAILALGLTERYFVRRMLVRLRRARRLRRRILIVGTDDHAVGLCRSYQHHPSLGYEVVGFVGDDHGSGPDDVPVVGPVSELSTLLAQHDATGVVVSIPGVGSAVNSITRRVTDDGYHVALSSSLRDIDISRIRAQELDGETLLYVERTRRGGWRGVAKRAFDVTAASGILLLSLPVVLLAALAIKLTSPGPVLFRQQRVGRQGRTFEMLKLRTMVVDAEARLGEVRAAAGVDNPLFKMKSDPRVTPVGHLLRKLSIDELPQLWCVLRGTMSMVGPRPMLPREAEEFDPYVVRERVRVPPGLTGLWQVSGRSESSFESYCRWDQYYVDNWTLGHDLRICLRTVGVVLFGRGAM